MWSDDQELAIQRIRRWWKGTRKELTLGGLAGTGKTTIAAHLPRTLGLRTDQVAYCTYTGKASRVLSNKLSRSTAVTIERLMYHHTINHCNRCPACWNSDAECQHNRDCCPYQRMRRELDPAARLVVVDEASMVDEETYERLTSYRTRIVWIGDHGQLPPVKGRLNLMAQPDIRLEKIHRQAAGSPILKLAMLARQGRPLPLGQLGPAVCRTDDFELSVDDQPSERKKQLILCWKNSTRVELNALARQHLDFPPNRPAPGERVICKRNNSRAGIFNGDLGTLLAIQDVGKRYRVRIQLDDSRQPYVGIIAAEQFGMQTKLEVGNADLFDYGYCLTVHSSQGSEADGVILVDEYPTGYADRARWLYTGITRAKRELTIIAA